jgi:hypothetical protein
MSAVNLAVQILMSRVLKHERRMNYFSRNSTLTTMN